MSRAAVPLLTLGLVLAACSASTTGGTPQASAQAPTPAASAAAPSTAAGAATINLEDSKLGKVLADGSGKTLYVFTVDADGKSNCSGDCGKNWPALTSAAAPTLGTGLDAEDFKTIADTNQVTFYGHPLYYFAGDKAAGDTNGQGVGGKWFTVGADGNMMGATASPAASAAASPAAGGSTVALADTSLGSVLVGANGMTLYAFTADSAGTSTCTGNCASNWPALTSATAPTVGTGLDASSFKTISGTNQVTVNGQPLYYFAGDKAAGDTNGQGVAGKWYVVGADGKMMQ
jgi:predicted lipoprotein with Yx(FWY)xxD motif